MALHEFGHFALAKKFGVKVKEFGLGYPPRIFGKEIRGTLYSLNLIPFGAFVRFPEESEPQEEAKFSQQPIYKRMIIALGGVASFWLIAAMLLGLVFFLGARLTIDDETKGNLVAPRVQVIAISAKSPAAIADLRPGDAILSLESNKEKKEVTKVKEVQEFTDRHLGQTVILSIERGKEIRTVSLMPRSAPPEGEGPIGIALARTAIQRFPWYACLWQGISTTISLTGSIGIGYFLALKNVFLGLPSGVEVMGPVGIVHLVSQVGQLGLTYLAQFIALISIYMAIFNILPIPVADGGKVALLIIEVIRRKPIKPEIEQKLDAVFFVLLIALIALVTIKDIIKLF